MIYTYIYVVKQYYCIIYSYSYTQFYTAHHILGSSRLGFGFLQYIIDE